MQSKRVIPLHYIYSKVIIGDQNDYQAFWISNFHNVFGELPNASLEKDQFIPINFFNDDTTINVHKMCPFWV